MLKNKLKSSLILASIFTLMLLLLVFRVEAYDIKGIQNYDVGTLGYKQSDFQALQPTLMKSFASNTLSDLESDWVYTVKDKEIRLVKFLAPLLQHLWDTYGLYPSTIVAQAALESSWGANVFGYNWFGIKHGQSHGTLLSNLDKLQTFETVSWNKNTGEEIKQTAIECPGDSHGQGDWLMISGTKEDYGNGKINTTGLFSFYFTLSEAAEGYSKIVLSNRYMPGILSSDYAVRHKALKDGGYATDSEYVSLLNELAVRTITGTTTKISDLDYMAKEGTLLAWAEEVGLE